MIERNIANLKQETGGRDPAQLLMIIPGEGGVGKSRTIQAITTNFIRRNVAHLLVKSAFTGIAASLIEGKTLHVVAQMSVNGDKRSQKATRMLTKFWREKRYLIDEMSMVACHLLAHMSAALSKGKNLAGMEHAQLPFGGVNVVLVGDFHQFPPVCGKPLYWKLDRSRA